LRLDAHADRGGAVKVHEPIRLRGISKSYGRTIVLDDIGFDVAAGEFLTLLGPSGSGKSTLLMIVAGFVRPEAGSILVDGREFVDLPPHRRGMGVVFQNYALFPHMTVAQNVAFPLRYRKLREVEMAQRVREALAMVRLDGYERRRIDELSGGQRQRVALARAIVFEPTILLMDEPLSALDKKLREQMQVELRQLQRKLGITTIYVTHDQREALTLSDRVAVLNAGQILQIDTPERVYERPSTLFVADFMGDSQFLRIEMIGDHKAMFNGSSLDIGHSEVRLGPGMLLLRPEKLELVTPSAAASFLNQFPGRVQEIRYHGDQVVVAVLLSSGDTVMVRRGTGEQAMRALPAPGAEVVLGLHPKDSIVVGDG
jgi:putative spermidine/putrescine transport system ATP-binding protein